MSDPILVVGAPGSPYTRKMLSVLRYRRLPYRFVSDSRIAQSLPQPRVRLLPIFYLADGDELLPVTDSTPIIRRLDAQFQSRPISPADPALAFLDALIEDYADEWVTKAMFHYRWVFPADIRKSSTILPNWFGPPLDDELLALTGDAFAERQIGRLSYVGSNAVTAPVIESSFVRLVDLIEDHLKGHEYMFGGRPTAADFALYGQFTQLALFDPTPMAIVDDRAPRLVAWTIAMEDRSGVEDSALMRIDALPSSINALLAEIGRTYAPLLLANAQAIAAGHDIVRTKIDGCSWEQPTFPYHVKCLDILRAHYDALPPEARMGIDALLSGTGCASLFAH